MKTFKMLMNFNIKLTNLAAQANYYDFSKNFKIDRINDAFSNIEKLVKKDPIKLESLTTTQFKILQFEYNLETDLYIIPLYIRHLLPENLYVYEKHTKEKGLITEFSNLTKIGVIPNSIEYNIEKLSEGFCFYLRHGYFPNDA